jgi:hypothetical protein
VKRLIDSQFWALICAVIFGLGLWASNDLRAWFDSWRSVQTPAATERCK